MSSDEKINSLTNIPEDENGTRRLAPHLPKEFSGDKAKQPKLYTRILKVLNPFLLLAFGGLLTGLLLPYITNKWQDHQKELDLKSSLVSQMTESVATLQTEFDAIKLDELPLADDPTQPAQLYNQFINIIDQWNIKATVIRSELQVYYPKGDLVNVWQGFVSSMFSLTDLFIDTYDYNRQTDTLLLSGYLNSNGEAQCIDYTDIISQKVIRQCINWDNLRMNYISVINGAGLLKPSVGDLAVVEDKISDILKKIELNVIQSPISAYS